MNGEQKKRKLEAMKYYGSQAGEKILKDAEPQEVDRSGKPIKKKET